jgi:hypothetical protein
VTTPTAEPEAHGRVASATPGRLRVRIDRAHRHPALMHRIQGHLEGRPGIAQVEVNHGTGSVVVRYDDDHWSGDDLLGLFRDLGLVVRDILEAGEELPPLGGSSASNDTMAAVGRLNRRISHLTGQTVDLRFLFPAALGALALRQAWRQGLGLNQIPAYVLLWYAFDAFWKLNVQSERHDHLPRRDQLPGQGER